MKYLFFDTETTGVAHFKLPVHHPAQPHLVQLAAVLHDENKQVRGSMNVIIQPDGWEIPESASNIHGITTEMARNYGIDLGVALEQFEELLGVADMVVAHNMGFDSFVMRTQSSRTLRSSGLNDKPQYCTMQESTNILKLPGKYGFKWPKLEEAHRHFTVEGFDNAHNALADVEACARVFYHLPRQEKLAV